MIVMFPLRRQKYPLTAIRTHQKDQWKLKVSQMYEVLVTFTKIEGSYLTEDLSATKLLFNSFRMGFVSCQTYGGHEGYVSAVAAMPVTGEHPQGAVVTGCQDGKIRIFHPYSSSPSQTLVGHTESGNVSSFPILQSTRYI